MVLGGVDRGGGEDIRPQSSLPTPQALHCSMHTEGAQPLRSASSIPEFGIVHHVLLVFHWKFP